MPDPNRVQCSACGTLLAKRLPGGGVEARSGRSRLVLRDGAATLTCPRCHRDTEVEAKPRRHEMRVLVAS